MHERNYMNSKPWCCTSTAAVINFEKQKKKKSSSSNNQQIMEIETDVHIELEFRFL